MFDLENGIKGWKQSFVPGEFLAQEELSELESQLRDSIAELGHLGLSLEESFVVAAQRLGHPTTLAAEFSKSNRSCVWRNRLLWMLVGCVGYSVCSTLLQTTATLTSTWVAMTGLGTRATGATAVGVLVVGWASLFAVGCLAYHRATDSPNRIPVPWLIAAGVLLLVGYGLSQSAIVFLQTRSMNVAQFNETLLFRSIADKVVQAGLFIASICLIGVLNEPKTTDVRARMS